MWAGGRRGCGLWGVVNMGCVDRACVHAGCVDKGCGWGCGQGRRGCGYGQGGVARSVCVQGVYTSFRLREKLLTRSVRILLEWHTCSK